LDQLAKKVLTQENTISQYIPYSHHITNTIISTKTADYVSVWRLSGRPHQSASSQDIFNWISDLNNLIRSVCSDNVSLWSHVVRRRIHEYPQGQFDNIFCQQLDQHYQQSFANTNLMVNNLYLTIVYRPISDKVLSFLSHQQQQTLIEKQHNQQQAIKVLQDINHTIAAGLRRYHAELLGIYDHKGHAYSSALEFLASLINGEHIPMPITRNRFSDYIAHNRLMFAKWGEVGEIRMPNQTKYFGMLEIADYDSNTEPGHLNILLESNFEFILSQSFSALSRYAAQGFLERHKKHLIDSKDAAYGQINEIDDALDQLISGQFVMGEHHATLLVYGQDTAQVHRHLATAKALLMDVAIIAKPVDLALEAGYWAQLPGNWKYRPRPAPITSLNFLSFSSFHNFMSGKPTRNPWGDAVTIFKTTSGTPLYFNFHASNVNEDATDKRLLGNTMLIGKSGSGKTVLLGFLLAQAQKFKPTVVLFDKDRGMEIIVRALGGCYLPLKMGEPSGFNPFQLPPTAGNLIFLKMFIKRLVQGDGQPITTSDEAQIDQALQTLMHHIDVPLRCLSTLLHSLPNPTDDQDSLNVNTSSIHARLIKWCQGGQYGWLFDNATDALNLSTHHIYGFDITDFLDNDDIRGAIMMYLVYRTESMVDGRKFIYMFDEFWKMLSDPYFEEFAKNKEKTIRKQNGIFVFATQEPSDALESPIAKTLIQQCATFIFLPNPSADADDYIKGFKITPAEFNLIKNLSEDSRRFLIKQGEGSVVAELDLNSFNDELSVFSGTPDNAVRVSELVNKLGPDPAQWLPAFYQKVRGTADV